MRYDRLLRNPGNIPAELITDPMRPIPPSIAKSKRLMAMLEDLRDAYQRAMRPIAIKREVKDPQAVYEILAPIMAPLNVEHLAILPLTARMRAKTPPILISRGDIDGVDLSTRAIYRNALVTDAHSIILAHNHPTGDPSPSAADRAVTTRVVQAGRSLDMELQDHIIIAGAGGIEGGPKFYSLRRNDPSLWR